MSSEKKFRIQNGLDVAGEVFVNGINIVGADGVLNEASYQTAVQAMIDATVAQGVDQGSIGQAVDKAVSDLADAAPATLDTLNELAAALGDDANFATSMTNALNTKLNSANNLSDVADAAAARSNLGLGTAATAATTSFATAAQGAKADAAATASDLTALETQISSGVATLAQGAKADTAVQPEDFFTVADGTTTSYVADWSQSDWGSTITDFSAGIEAGVVDYVVDMQVSNDGHVVTVHASQINGSPGDVITYYIKVWSPSGQLQIGFGLGNVTLQVAINSSSGSRLVSADITDTHLFVLSMYGSYHGYSVYSLDDLNTPIGGIRSHSEIMVASNNQKALIRHCGEDKLLLSSKCIGGTGYGSGASGIRWETETAFDTNVQGSDSYTSDFSKYHAEISVDAETGWIYAAYRSGVVKGYNHITNQHAPDLTGSACAVGDKYVVVHDSNSNPSVSVYDVGTNNLVTSITAPPMAYHQWGGWASNNTDMATNGDGVIVTGKGGNTAFAYAYDMSSSSKTTIRKEITLDLGPSNAPMPPQVYISKNNHVSIISRSYDVTLYRGPVAEVVTPNVDASTLASKVYVDNAVANADPDLSSYPNTTEMTTAIATAKTEAQTYADGAVADAIDAAPAGLDTLNELAAALNDDANFASTITTSLATKADATDVQTLQDSLDISGKLTVQSSTPTVGGAGDVWISSSTGVVHKAKPSGIVERTTGTWTGTDLSGVPRSGSNRLSLGNGMIDGQRRYGVLFTSTSGMSLHGYQATDYYVHKSHGAAYVEWVDPIYIQYWNEEGKGQDTYLEWVLYEDGTQAQYGGNSPVRAKVTLNTSKRVKGMTFNTVSNLNRTEVLTIKAVLPQSGTWEETGQIDLSPYSTTAEMNSAIATAVANADVDLSAYSTTAEMNTAISNVSVDLSGYSTTTEMNSAITAEVANVVDAAPAALDTLNELAAALGDDANFASTVTTSLATKASTSDLATKANVSETGLVGELIVPSTETSISYQGEVEGPTYVARLSETSAGDVSVYNINDMETSLFDAQMFPWGAAESISWVTSKYVDSTVLPTQTSTSGTYAVGVYRTNQEVNDYPSRTVFNASSNSFIRRLRITDLVRGAQGNGHGSFTQIHAPKALARALPGYSYHSGNANLVVSGSLVNDAWRSQGENGFAWKVMSGEDGMWVGDKDKSSLYYYHQVSIYPNGNDTWTSSSYGTEFQYQGMYRSPTEALHKTSNMGYRVTFLGQYTDTNETPFSSMNNFAHNFTTIGRCAIIMSNDGSKKLWVHNPHATPGIVASVSFDGPSDATSDFGTSMVSSPDNKWLLIGDGVSVWFYDVSNIDWSSKDSTSVPSIAPVKISKETFEDENGENAFAPLGYNAAKNGFAAQTNVKGGKGSLFLTNTEAFVGTDSYVIRFDLTDLTKTPDQLSVPGSHTVTDIMVSDNVIHIQTDAPSNDPEKAIMSKDLTDIPITGAAIYGSWTDAHTDGLYNSNNLLQVSSDVDLYSNTTIGLNTSIPVTSIGTVTESIVPSSSLTKAINYLENKSVDLSGYSTTAEMNTAIANADIAVSSSDLDMNGNKVLFANVYSTLGDLPSASTYHGMFAHVHGTGKAYYAHAGNWVELADASSLLTQSDIDTAIANADVDLSGYSTTAEMNSAITAEVANVVDAAPAALDTLNELAAALGDDANFASTVTASLATKSDSTATTAALATKASQTDLDANTAAIATKASQTDLDTNTAAIAAETARAQAAEADLVSHLGGDIASGDLTITGTANFNGGLSFGDGNGSIGFNSGVDDIQVLSNMDMQGNKLLGVGAPVDSVDVTTKGYVDGEISTSLSTAAADATAKADAAQTAAIAAAGTAATAAIAATIDAAPASLDTLNELAAALGDDANFASTVTASLATKSDSTATTAAISAETTARESADSDLQSAIDALSGVQSGDTSSLTSQIATAKSQAISTASADATVKSDAAQAAASADATTKADAAQSQAISTASDTATALANAAQAQAIATASADATSKADQAETDAKAYADQVVAATVDAAPAALDTLNELAAALGDDANFASTVTASLATKADDAATTAALATKADVTTVTALDVSIKGSEPAPGPELMGDVTVSDLDGGQSSSTTHSSGGIQFTRTGVEVAIFNLATEIGKEYEISYFGGMSPASGNNKFAVVPSGFVPTISNYWANNILKDASGTNKTDLVINSNAGTQSESGTFIATTTTVQIIFFNGSMDETHYIKSISVKELSFGILDTTATHVIPAINELHTEIGDIVSTQSGDVSTLTSDIAAETTARQSAIAAETSARETAITSAISTASTDATAKADQAETDAKAYADQVVAATVDAAPAALDTLNELSAALGDDANFASTVTTSIATKASQVDLDAEAVTRSNLGSQLLGYININGSAISTETTARQAAIVTAKSEAVALAASDATTKADAAQAAAISTASTDATAKADQAETDAKAYADQVVAATVDAAPNALNTLNELAAALGDDANFASTVTTSIATKADDVATTAALATKADDAATTTALATKATVVDVDALDTFVKGTTVTVNGDLLDETTGWNVADAPSEVTYDANTGRTTFASSGGLSRIATKEISGLIVGETYTLSGTGYQTSGATNPGRLVVGVGTIDTTSFGLYSQIVANLEAQRNFDDQVRPDVSFVATSSTYYVTVMGKEYGLDGAMHMEDISVVGNYTTAPTLATESSSVLESINELHTEIATLSGTDTTLTASITDNTAAITAETSARTTADSTLQSSIDSEVARATAAEGVLTTAVSDETSARTSADTTLQSNIDTVSGRVDTILNGSSTSLDTIVEVVSAFENADSDLQTLISSNAGSHATNATAISTETTRATTAESALQTAIDTEETARAQAISAEETARITFDASLQDQINALDTQETTSKSSLQLSIDNEVTRATTAEGVNAAAISAETTARTSAISAETTARESAVTSAISTASSDATTKADAAEADAIATSSADATSKANAAQSAAVSTASSDATAKANAAQSAAEATASADATTKADAAQAAAAVDATTKSDAALVSAQTYADNAASTAVANVIDAAPASLDTLNELAAALGDDANFASTMTNSLATKANTADVATAAQGVKADSALQPGDAVSLTVDNSDKLDGQQSSHFRIDIYDINGNIVN